MDATLSRGTFIPVVEYLTETSRKSIAQQILDQDGLSTCERAIVAEAAHRALLESAERKLNRVLLLELHAAKLSGHLQSSSEDAQFAEFVRQAMHPDFVEALSRRYPVLWPRLDRALAQQGRAILSLVARLVADRDALAPLMPKPAGELRALTLGEGDVHNGGQTVARLQFAGGSVMYKPRSLRIDVALDGFLAKLFPNRPDRIRVPAVLDRGEYGWAEFVEHTYCADDAELATFYRNVGHWLAVMRLVGGTDIHHENLIAAGAVPVVVDVESLFVLDPELPPSDLGQAVDLAEALIRSSVLRTGLVPFRAPVLGLNGVDISALGALQGEQPPIRVPEIVDHGTLKARVGMVEVELGVAKNHPCAKPDVSRYWDRVVSGFQQLTRRLLDMQAEGTLAPLLDAFPGCQIRCIRRPTQSYVEIMRMLWHPASLHDEAAAIARAHDLLRRNAEVVRMAPAEPEVIAAEIDDMRFGDIPVFADALSRSQMDEVLAGWRGMRQELEELTIRGALVTVHLNARLNDDQRTAHDLTAHRPSAERIDQRRREMAARTLRELLHLSVRGDDGTMTWISPILGRTGWAMRTLQPDLYVGLGGIAVAIAGYMHEMEAGRADAVDGVADALAGVVRVMHAAEAAGAADAVGGFVGLGSQILTWLMLHGMRPDPALLAAAVRRAGVMESRDLEGERVLDILEGVSGAIVPLLHLADATHDGRWLDLAVRAGRRLEATAIVDERGARWPASVFDQPLGGFAHGATGAAWALTRLGLSEAGSAVDRQRWHALAARAFDFEDSLYLGESGNWIDVRKPQSRDYPNTWCHGSVGIGLAACDLYTRTGDDRHLDVLRRATRAACRGGWGYSHTLCHGDLSFWELLMRAGDIDPTLVPQDAMPGSAIILSSIEEHGIVGGLARDAFSPGLMSGISGSIHQLTRMHPDCPLPSPLLMECRLGEYRRRKTPEAELVAG